MSEFLERYEEMKKKLDQFFSEPAGRIILVSGENALGKTYQLEQSAKRSGFNLMDHREALHKSSSNNVLIHVGGGKYGPTFLYELLYANDGRVIHFEENIFLNAKNRSFLIEGATHNFEFKYPGDKVPDRLPGSFIYTGGIVITTYQPGESIYKEILDISEFIDVGLKGDSESLLTLLEHELPSIVESYNRKMHWKTITMEDAERAMALYRSQYEKIRKERSITPPYMVNFLWVFEMLRTLTDDQTSEETKILSIEQSFNDIPGNVTHLQTSE